MNRVVITGLGTISPIGLSTKSYWNALTAGQSGFGPPTIFAAERLNTKVVAEVKGFVPEHHFDARQLGLQFLQRLVERVYDSVDFNFFVIELARRVDLQCLEPRFREFQELVGAFVERFARQRPKRV